MKLSDVFLNEQTISSELERAKKLLIKNFKSYLGNKSRDAKLDFIENILKNILNKSESKFLILRLQKNQSKK